MIATYDKWETQKKEEPPETAEKILETTAPKLLEKGPGFMAGARRLATIALNLLIWAAWGTGGFYTGKLYGAPSFSQARAQFEIEGKKEDGERLFELGKACQDNSEMPMACKVLYFYQPEVMTARKF